MRRKKLPQPESNGHQSSAELVPEPAPRDVHVIDPNAVYLKTDAERLLRLRESTIRREIREGRLRVSKRGGRYYVLGAWLLEWLEGGELSRRRPALTSDNHNGEIDR